MSFAAQTKKELTLIEEAEACCEQAELAALIRMNGTVQLSNQRVILDISTENAAIARRIYSLLKRNYDLPYLILYGSDNPLLAEFIGIPRQNQPNSLTELAGF